MINLSHNCLANHSLRGITQCCFTSFIHTVPTGYPLDILTTEVNSTKVGLAWKPPPLEQRNGDIIGYRLSFWETTSNSNWTTFTTESAATVIDDLDPHTEYTIVVAASTAVGTGPYSPSLTVRTLEDGESYVV